MKNKNFPQTIYATHESWGGDTYYMDKESMQENIESLRELGDEWESISISDCDEYILEHEIGDGTALYRGEFHHDGYHRNGRMRGVLFEKISIKTGEYRRIEAWDTVDEFLRERSEN